MENFGNINNAFSEVFISAILKKDNNGKRKYQKYLNTIKESDILRTQYLVYNNIETKFGLDDSDISEYIKENINLLKTLNVKEIKAVNDKLIKLLGEDVKYLKKDYNKKALYENISKLTSKSNPMNVDTVLEAKKIVAGYVINNTEKEPLKEDLIPSGVLSKVIIRKFNDKYEDLDENAKTLIKISVDSNKELQKEFYDENIKECLSLTNESIGKEKDVSTKERLLNVKERLLEMKYDVKEFSNEITKLISLKMI